MSGYTKLFSSIIASTIWRADDKTRIVWITLLAMADRRGIVEASMPGLADMARMSLSACRQALDELEAPDEYSRSKEHEGRRILPISGGWLIVNYAKYRNQMSADDRREYLRQKKAESRARQHPVNNRQQPSTLSTHTDPAPDPDPKADLDLQEHAPPARARKALPPGFAEFWSVYPKRKSKADAEKAWGQMQPPLDAVLSALKWQVSQPGWVKDGGQFIPYPASWLRARGWQDEPFEPLAPKRETTAEQAARILAGNGRMP